MIYNSDLSFSRLGMGFMRHDENDFNKTQQLVDYAIANGVNYFEACSFYLHHKCENIVGKALAKYPRESYYLCDKFDAWGSGVSLDHLETFFDNQLSTCNVDYFDVYLLQALDRKMINKIQPVYDFFKQKQAEGKIKLFGFSFHDTDDILKQYLDNYKWDICQIQLNYYDWYLGEAKKLYNMLAERNIPIIVMGPYKGGTLTTRQPYTVQQHFTLPYLSHLAMHFLQTLPQVKVILTGAEQLSMLQENVNLIDNYSFTQQDKENCQKIIAYYQKKNAIECTGCKYCEPGCPRHIPISRILQTYNKMLLNPTDKALREEFTILSKSDHSFFDCIHCGQCDRRCPQHLPISDYCFNQLFTARL